MNLDNTFKSVAMASRKLALVEEQVINQLLSDLSEAAVKNTAYILKENKKDLARMPESDPKYDRLKLTEQRIKDIASDLVNVSRLPSPLGRILDKRNHENGLELTKISVPLGVVGIIYEARPNVTFDVFSLCIKSGNACILKGGSDAEYSNIAIVGIIKDVIRNHGLNENIENIFLNRVEEWLQLVKNKDCHGFALKMSQVKKKLKELDPDYENAYSTMYKLMDNS